jgi:hypothetical protein
MNSIINFSYSDPDYPTSGLIVTELSRVYCTCFVSIPVEEQLTTLSVYRLYIAQFFTNTYYRILYTKKL